MDENSGSAPARRCSPRPPSRPSPRGAPASSMRRGVAPSSVIRWKRMLQKYVSSGCCKSRSGCCICCICMLQDFVPNVSVIFPTYVASVFICMLHVFHTYVACVLSGCCIYFAMIFSSVFRCFTSGSDVCCKYFNCFRTYVANVLFGCFKR